LKLGPGSEPIIPDESFIKYSKKHKMNTSFITWILIGGLLACKPQVNDIDKLDTSNGISGFYGEKITADNAVSIRQLHSELLRGGTFEGKVRGEIKEVCVNKGCWMTMALPDGNLMRVTFKDYGFFVPTDAQGYQVVIEGLAVKSVTDVAMLRHYAEDAGKSREEIEAIQTGEESFTFEATGVIISKAI
jgi:hypothetical protein